MSIAALLQGVETRLRSAAVLDDEPGAEVGKVCGVQPADGTPPGGAGQFYYAVWFAGIRSADMNAQSIDWFYNATVTITGRMGQVPRDRRGARIVLENELLDRAIVVATALHQDDTHRIRANEVIVGSGEYVAIHGGSATVNGFLEPLRLASISAVKKCPPSWFPTSNPTDSYYVDVSLRDARRVQIIGG